MLTLNTPPDMAPSLPVSLQQLTEAVKVVVIAQDVLNGSEAVYNVR